MSKTSRDNKKRAAMAAAAIAAGEAKAEIAKPDAQTCQACSFYRKGEPCVKTEEHVARKQAACVDFKRRKGAK